MSAATIVAIAVVAQPAAGLWRRACQGLGSVVDEAVAGSAGKAESTTASCQEECSGQARNAVAPVDGTGLEGLHAVVLLRVL